VERRIELDGCHNFRDLGGYPTEGGGPVRWRVVFRSDALHHLSRRGVDQLRDELRIGDVLDLRSSGELRTDGRGLLADEPVRFHHLPLFDGAVSEGRGEGQGDAADLDAARARAAELTLADRYFLLAGFARDAIARVIATLARSGGPAVYHCAAGKDRTGLISAVLLGLLGVRDELIVADYVATRENLDQIIDRLMATRGYQEMLAALPPDTLHAEPETMHSLLERMRDRYGSLREYVREIGVSDDDVANLRQRLLES
jgi:protein-tyrosine phosphatase